MAQQAVLVQCESLSHRGLCYFKATNEKKLSSHAAVKQIKPHNICINCRKQIVPGKQNRGWKCNKSSSLNLEMSPGFGELESGRTYF